MVDVSLNGDVCWGVISAEWWKGVDETMWLASMAVIYSINRASCKSRSVT
jgi:hypothetical protein